MKIRPREVEERRDATAVQGPPADRAEKLVGRSK